jgi:hypothetical protein
MARISQGVDMDMEKNIHKVVFKNCKTIVSGTITNGQVTLPVGKSGEKCFSAGFANRVGDIIWNDLEWLPESEILSEELGNYVLKDVITAYKDNQKKKEFLKE